MYLVADVVFIYCLHENPTNVGATVVADNGCERQLVRLENSLLRFVNQSVNVLMATISNWTGFFMLFELKSV
jgi:hypothetical protein